MQELPYFFPISKHNNSPLFFVYIKNYSYFCIVKC